jgi:DNA-binding response OmpR family regulator
MRILLVEDDERIAMHVSKALGEAGYVVEHAANGEDAWFLGDTEKFAAVVLDLGLPGLDGLTVLNRWRDRGCETPVLVLTARARGAKESRVSTPGPTTIFPSLSASRNCSLAYDRLSGDRAGRASSVLTAGRVSLDEQHDHQGRRCLSSTFRRSNIGLLLSDASARPSRPCTVEIRRAHLWPDHQTSNAVEVLVARVRSSAGALSKRRGFGYLVPDTSQ